MQTTVTLPILSALFSSSNRSQDYTQLGLPEGAIARIGKGSASDIQYSPDGTRLAVSTTVGTWLYDTATYQEISLFTSKNITFSPDANTIAEIHEDVTVWEREATVQLWDARTGKHKLKVHSHRAMGWDNHQRSV